MNEKLERLIARHLDGELTPEEELELNRAIIRDPEAHQILEDYKRIDALSGSVLSEALDGGCEFDLDSLPEQNSPPRRRVHSPAWWLVPGAIAATFLVVIFGQSSSDKLADSSGFTDPISFVEGSDAVLNAPVASEFDRGSVRRASTGSPMRRVRYDTVRDLTGVIGDDGKIYWFEIDRTRKIKRQPQDSRLRLTRDDL